METESKRSILELKMMHKNNTLCIKLTDFKIKTPNTGKMWGNGILTPILAGVEASWRAIRQHTPQSLSITSFVPICSFQSFYSKRYLVITEYKVLLFKNVSNISKLSGKTQLTFNLFFWRKPPNIIFSFFPYIHVFVQQIVIGYLFTLYQHLEVVKITLFCQIHTLIARETKI